MAGINACLASRLKYYNDLMDKTFNVVASKEFYLESIGNNLIIFIVN